MPTTWNPIAPGEPMRASDIQEIRTAIDNNLTAAGWEPFVWTDTLVAGATPVRALHFQEMREVIQDLWNRKAPALGCLPSWSSGGAPAAGSPIYASDVLDLRNWVNQYENTP